MGKPSMRVEELWDDVADAVLEAVSDADGQITPFHLAHHFLKAGLFVCPRADMAGVFASARDIKDSLQELRDVIQLLPPDDSEAEDESKLKPCPFCGGEAELIVCDEPGNEGGHAVQCKRCLACSPVRFSLKEDARPLVAEMWNRRLPPQPLAERSAETPCRDGGGSAGPGAVATDESGGAR